MTRTSPHATTRPGLRARVARRFFLEGRSKVDIAEELNLSRFKVARLLDEALDSGFVRITIGCPGAIDVDLSSRLRDAFRLGHSVVIRDDGLNDPALQSRLATVTADLLGEIVGPRDVLGVSWWSSVAEMGAAVHGLAPCDVVQLTGSSLGAGPGLGLPEVVRGMARVGRGTPYTYDAPVMVPDAGGALARRRQLGPASAAMRFDSLTKAVVGIGSWRRAGSAAFDALAPADAAAWAGAGACAEVAGVVLAGDGLPVPGPGYSVGVAAGQIRAIPDVIGVAQGEDVTAVTAALATGLVNGLVTHQALAVALLRG